MALARRVLGFRPLWIAFGPDGGVADRGLAASKPIGSACIRRALTRMGRP